MAHQCPSCQSAYTLGSRFCATCGTSLLNPAASDQTSSQTTTASGLIACPRCQSSNQPDSTYCYSRGFPQEGAIHAAEIKFPRISAYAQARPGGFWIRLVAYFIDGILLFIIFSVFWALDSGGSFSAYWDTNGFETADLVSLIFNGFYYTVGVAIWATTIGKKALGLRLVRTDGSKVGPGRALARYLAYFVSAITLGIGYLMVAFRQDKRGLHDLICDTVVIQR